MSSEGEPDMTPEAGDSARPNGRGGCTVHVYTDPPNPTTHQHSVRGTHEGDDGMLEHPTESRYDPG